MTNTITPRTTAASTTTGRFWFAADAVISGVNGLAYLAAAGPIADLLGGQAATYRWLGVFMLGYAAVVGLYARSSLSKRTGWAVVVGNVVWVLASLEVALTGMFDIDGFGRAWVVAQALVVADLALMQARSLRAR
ncbi:hypothetical protein ACOACQ_16095 [Nocardioides sp. CPCC 206347]|uniref:hypothetical protein n=2 Tax=Nocardioides TaxID=1839 RepID=UPI003B428871